MPRPSVSISVPRTRSSRSSRRANPLSFPTPRGRARHPRSLPFSKTGEVLVGEVAKRQAITNRTAPFGPSSVIWARPGPSDIDGKAYTPQEISARILQKLKRGRRGLPRRHRPAGGDHRPGLLRRRPASGRRKPGEVAGLEVLRIINEPTAAALAYGLDKENDLTILVL